MTDNAPTQDAAAPTRGPFWLAGRASRREYWLYVAPLVAVSLLLADAPPAVDLLLLLALILVQIRRIHDFGRTGWWAVAATAAPLVALPLIAVQSEYVTGLVGAAITLIFIVGIGAAPGDRGDNRFGPPPPFTLRRLLTGR